MTTPFVATFAVENAHNSDIYAVAACQRFTIAAAGDGVISLWDNAAPSEELTTLDRAPSPAGTHHLAVSAAGTHAVAVCFDGAVLAYDLQTQARLDPAAAREIRGAWCCALARDSVAAVATLRGTVVVFDVATGERLAELTEPQSSGDVKRQPCLCVDISSDAQYVAAGYEGGKLRVFSVETGRVAYTLPTHVLHPRSVRFNPQATVLAVTGGESIALYTLTGGAYLGSLPGRDALVYSISFDPTGERLLSVAGDGRVKVWSLDSREAVFTAAPSNQPLFAGCWIPERTNIIAGAPAGFVTVGADRCIRWFREASGSAADF